MKFVLENKNILFDFQYELYRQKEYYDWLNIGKPKELQTEMVVCTERELKNVLPDTDLKEWCPVGSVEFCVDWYKRVWNKRPLPKNVPDELIKMCNRRIGYMNNDLDPRIGTFGDNIFVKDTETIKSHWNGIKNNNNMWMFDGDHLPHFHFQVSEVMDDINSEWRCFIYQSQLVDMRCYSGDFFDVPDRDYIAKCIDAYSDKASVAYTLDICTRDNHPNEVIEVHDFFSCGLYGFNDNKYPLMLWRWFKEFTKE